jgi:hypothetical protein
MQLELRFATSEDKYYDSKLGYQLAMSQIMETFYNLKIKTMLCKK